MEKVLIDIMILLSQMALIMKQLKSIQVTALMISFVQLSLSFSLLFISRILVRKKPIALGSFVFTSKKQKMFL